jgi:hypothetical protein
MEDTSNGFHTDVVSDFLVEERGWDVSSRKLYRREHGSEGEATGRKRRETRFRLNGE